MLLIIILAVFGCFALVVLFGAPYLPTLKAQQQEALDLFSLKPGQVLLELGSGDGRFLLAAAKRGIKVIGYELNPILFIVSLVVTIRYRHLVTIKMANFWLAKWPKCDAIYIFSMPKFMPKLNKKLVQLSSKKLLIISYAAQLPNRKLLKKQNGLFVYML
jgi:hypothetical protein